MIKRFLKALSVFALLIFVCGYPFGWATAATDQSVPQPMVSTCAVDHDGLPQYVITSEWAVGVLIKLKNAGHEIFGTAQDVFNNVLIWYNSAHGHRMVILFPNGTYKILMPQAGVRLYNSGVSEGVFPQATK